MSDQAVEQPLGALDVWIVQSDCRVGMHEPRAQLVHIVHIIENHEGSDIWMRRKPLADLPATFQALVRERVSGPPHPPPPHGHAVTTSLRRQEISDAIDAIVPLFQAL